MFGSVLPFLRKCSVMLLSTWMLAVSGPHAGAAPVVRSAIVPCECATITSAHGKQVANLPDAPCRDSQNCDCASACGTAFSLPLSASLATARFDREVVAPAVEESPHGISTRPALPPPIA